MHNPHLAPSLALSRVAVVLPAYNEARTIEATIRDFRAALPDAEIVVVDNRSSDGTYEIAVRTLQDCGGRGRVLREQSPGKASAVRRAFLEVDADIYVMADADLTYPARHAHELIAPILRQEADMVVGDRISNGRYAAENKRPGHGWGNALVRSLVNALYGSRLNDILSGFRVFNRRFIQNYPILVRGFELETDVTLHALEMRHRIVEIPIDYQDRPEGSESKLSTVRDGLRVLNTIVQIIRHYRPLPFFGGVAALMAALGLAAGVPPINDYIQYRFVHHVPLAILAVGLELTALLCLGIGLILSTIVRGQAAQAERDVIAQRRAASA